MIQEATFGAGCFWCIEACYSQLDGVIEVYPGYAGGHKLNPTYEEVYQFMYDKTNEMIDWQN